MSVVVLLSSGIFVQISIEKLLIRSQLPLALAGDWFEKRK